MGTFDVRGFFLVQDSLAIAGCACGADAIAREQAPSTERERHRAPKTSTSTSTAMGANCRRAVGSRHFFAVVGGLAHGDGNTGGRPESLRVRCSSISETRIVGATVLTGTKPLSAPQ